MGEPISTVNRRALTALSFNRDILGRSRASHLVLKAFHHSVDHDRYSELTVAFGDAYHDTLRLVVSPPQRAALEARGVARFAACGWVRLDGKSGIDNRVRRDQVRTLCREVLDADVSEWTAVLDRSRQLLAKS